MSVWQTASDHHQEWTERLCRSTATHSHLQDGDKPRLDSIWPNKHCCHYQVWPLTKFVFCGVMFWPANNCLCNYFFVGMQLLANRDICSNRAAIDDESSNFPMKKEAEKNVLVTRPGYNQQSVETSTEHPINSSRCQSAVSDVIRRSLISRQSDERSQ